MKVHIKAFCLLLSGLLMINIMSFGAFVYAASAPSVGTPIPFGSLPSEQKDPFLNALKQFLHDFFGLYGEDSYIYVDPDTGEQIIGTEQEIYSYIQGKLETEDDDLEVNGIQDEYGNILYYTFVSSIPQVGIVNDLKSFSHYVAKSICGFSESSYHKSGEGVIHGGSGRIRIDASEYSESINDLLKKIASDSLSIGLDIINGVPQNVTTIKEDLYISVFDILGLQYTVAPSLLDYQFNIVTHKKSISYQNYTPFFITSDNKLYLFQAVIYTTARSSNNIIDYTFYSSNDHYSATINGRSSYNVRFSFRFVDNSNHLYFCLLSSCYDSSYNSISYTQQTNGRPGVSNAPLLFYDYRDGLDAPGSAPLGTNFINNELPDGIGISFINSVDNSDVLTDSDILSADILAAGCFQAHQYTSTTLNSAGQMLLSSDNVVSGGDKTITSDLAAWQKGIYLLAQQQGITYEEMLQIGVSLVIGNNGEMSIEDSDGIQYNLSELVKQYDEIIGAVGDISGDLSELLEYLKSLNLEGLESYIAAIEGTLNDLNERDKDNSVVLGGIGDTLTELKEILNNLDISDISSGVASIDNAISKAQEAEAAEAELSNQLLVMAMRHGTGTYKLYDQCKYLLDNLFNYSSRNYPPNFDFYYDSNGDGEAEIYRLIDLSFLENTLTNDNMVDKSWWSIPIKIIDLIRYIIAAVCYGLFVMRLLKRLPTFYGHGPLSLFG